MNLPAVQRASAYKSIIENWTGPTTPPRLVYASETFAALAAVDQVTQFVCDYVGIAFYVVRRSYEPNRWPKGDVEDSHSRNRDAMIGDK
jgi:hypothetical protein